MSLENLAKTGRLRPHSATPDEAVKLLAAARRNLQECAIAALSPETRFDLAYKVVMQCGLVALMANGYRPSTRVPGHHMTILQTLPFTLGLEEERVLVLDKLRRTRNVNDYDGGAASEEQVASCIRQAEGLLTTLTGWLEQHRKDWVQRVAPRGATNR